MSIRFSPGPCGCCNRVLFWINNYYFTRTVFVGFNAARTLVESFSARVDSWIPELKQNQPVLTTPDKIYSGNIADYNLVFWQFPYEGSPLPDWFNTVITGGYTGRIVIICGESYFTSSVSFFNAAISPPTVTGITLNINSYGANGFPVSGLPAVVLPDKLTKNVNALTKVNMAPHLFPGQSTVLSTAPNINDETEQLPWLARKTVGTVDWVVATDTLFADSGQSPEPVGDFRMLDNLLNVSV